MRGEVEAAGFVLDAVGTMLANTQDPHAIKVFDPSLNSHTDRFACRFVKPGQVGGRGHSAGARRSAEGG